jgi:hypothetical protein
MTPLTSSTSRLLLLGTRGKLLLLPVRLGFEGARYSVLRGLSPPSDAPFCFAAAAAATDGPAPAAVAASRAVNKHAEQCQMGPCQPGTQHSRR